MARLHVVPGNLDDLLERKVRDFPDIVEEGFREIADRAENELIARAPIFTGYYAGAITSEVTRSGDTVAVSVGSTARHAHLVERGRRAGKMPPVGKIMALFNVPRVEAWPIARALGRGTPANPAVADTLSAIGPYVEAQRRRILERLGDLHGRG